MANQEEIARQKRIADGIAADKECQEILKEAAKGFTDVFKDLGKNQTRGFIIYVYDYETGKVHYISDMPRDHTVDIVKNWCNFPEADKTGEQH
jgi:hypothetical protein